jgi:hypothetical protein
MDKHIKVGKYRKYHLPRTSYTIVRGTTQNNAVAIDGLLQLKSSGLLNGRGVLGALTQNFHDFRNDLDEPD